MTVRLLRLLFVAMFLALRLVGHASCKSSDEASAVAVYRVTSVRFRREIPADGTLEAVTATPINAPQDARMALKIAWMVEDGHRVTEGQAVIRFDPSEMHDRLRDGLDRTVQARKRISKEWAIAASLQRKRDREAAMAQSEMRAAEERTYTEDEAGIFSRNEIIESQIDRDLASARMDHARAAKDIERSVTSGKLEVLRVQERQAELEVSQSQKALGMFEIAAPHAGILLAHRDWRGRTLGVGDTVWPGQKIAEIPRDRDMEARVFVLEVDGGALEPGMPATLFIESRPEREYSAEIARIDTLAQPRIPDVPVQYFAVTLRLEQTDRQVMKIGQRVRATVLLKETQAIVVPRQAVFQDGSKSYVYLRVETGFEKIQVELGASSAGRVVVTSGLREGDEIALRQPRPSIREHSEDDGEKHAAR